MTINEKTTYTATSLPGAPPRDTRAEAEADEARGVELATYLAVLPTLTVEQWARVASQSAARDEAWNTARVAARVAARGAERDEAWDAARAAARAAARGTWDAAWDAGAALYVAWDAARAACAIVARDLITPDQFDTLTAPMRAAGIDFDGLAIHENGSTTDA